MWMYILAHLCEISSKCIADILLVVNLLAFCHPGHFYMLGILRCTACYFYFISRKWAWVVPVMFMLMLSMTRKKKQLNHKHHKFHVFRCVYFHVTSHLMLTLSASRSCPFSKYGLCSVLRAFFVSCTLYLYSLDCMNHFLLWSSQIFLVISRWLLGFSYDVTGAYNHKQSLFHSVKCIFSSERSLSLQNLLI